jgi:hypothetical protein
VLTCPFCGSSETDRFDLEGRRYVVFQCMFTPSVDPRLNEPEIARHLREQYTEGKGGEHFRRMCDRLHLYVTQGEGARTLTAKRRD